jgi:hypothetical protein
VTHTGAASIWPYVPATLWAAAMLGIFTWWMFSQNFDVARYVGYGVAAVALVQLGLFALAVAKGWKVRNDPAKLAAAENEIRPTFTFGILGSGIALLALGTWLAVAERLWTNKGVFAEVSSLAVMGLILTAAGLMLRVTAFHPLSRHRVFHWMLANRKNVAIGLMIAGGLVAALGLWCMFRGAGFREFFGRYPGGPEGIGLFLIGMVLLGGGLWTQLTLEQPATPETMRLLALYAGSLTGFFIAVFTGLRVIGWWTRYFAGGMRSWQGEDSWRFWACAYAELAGLLLLFGSLLLGRAEVRAKPIMRRLLYGYNAVLTGMLLLAMLVVANIIVIVNVPSNVEWNSSGMYSISDKTSNFLASLKEPVKIYVLMSRYGRSQMGPDPQDVRDLLDNFQSASNRVFVEYVSPDLDSTRYKELAKTYPDELGKQSLLNKRTGEGQGRGILVTYGEGPENKKLPAVFLPERDLVEMDMGSQMPLFNGERALMQAVQLLANNNKKIKVYFTQGHGEMTMSQVPVFLDMRFPLAPDALSVSPLVSKLRKDNYDVEALVWDNKAPRWLQGEQVALSKKKAEDPHAVPADCQILVIANPAKAFPKEVNDALDAYLKRGGKLVVLTRLGILQDGKTVDDGMPELCKKFNVDVGTDLLLKGTGDITALRIKAVVPREAKDRNKLASAFAKSQFVLFVPRSVKPGKGGSEYQADTLLTATEGANEGELYDETDTKALMAEPITFLRGLRNRKPASDVSVAVAVTDAGGTPRVVVFGDEIWLSDAVMGTQEAAPEARENYGLFQSSLQWLAKTNTEVIGKEPRPPKLFILPKSEVNAGRLFWLPLGLVTLALAGTGAGVWVVRRK